MHDEPTTDLARNPPTTAPLRINGPKYGADTELLRPCYGAEPQGMRARGISAPVSNAF